MLILDLWGISFHAVVVFGLGKNLLFKSVLGRCVMSERKVVGGNSPLTWTPQIFYEKKRILFGLNCLDST